MTLLEVLQSTTDYFKKRNVESSRLNAEHLLAHVLGRKRLELYLDFERELTEAELAPLREYVKRRGQGEPLQHLLGTVEFCGHTFLCDTRALIPRPETEELVEFVLQSTINHQPSTILDVGTGSGVIALSLALKLPDARVQATDISESALALAREVLHDPEEALFAGERGDEIVRELIEQVPSRLQPGGMLALEIGQGQTESLCEFLAQKKYHDIETKKDYSGNPRFLIGRYG